MASLAAVLSDCIFPPTLIDPEQSMIQKKCSGRFASGPPGRVSTMPPQEEAWPEPHPQPRQQRLVNRGAVLTRPGFGAIYPEVTHTMARAYQSRSSGGNDVISAGAALSPK